jgi:PAS domain-containing protein
MGTRWLYAFRFFRKQGRRVPAWRAPPPGAALDGCCVSACSRAGEDGDSRPVVAKKLPSGHGLSFFGYIATLPRPACRGVADVKGAWMAHPIEIILTRQLAEYLSVPLLLVDSKGNLLFYNEPAETILGRRFEDTGGMPAEQWSRSFTAVDEQGQAIAPDDLPLMVTLSTRLPAHRRLRIVDGDASRAMEVTAIPIAGLHGDFLGAAGMFWALPG